MSLTAAPAAIERTTRVRVVIADDHELIRAGLTRLLAAESDLVVVATASDGRRAVELVTEHRPDVVLMDLGMPVLDGIEATREIVRTSPSTRVLVLTCFAQGLVLENALAAGAHGYLVKHGSSLEVIDAVRRTHGGEAVFSPCLSSARRSAAGRAPRVAALP